MKTVAELRQQTIDYDMLNRNILDKYTDQEIAVWFNGIGAEWMNQKLRNAITNLSPSLQPVSLIHDCEFHESDGSTSGFLISNMNFYLNGCKVAQKRYKWYDPRRWIVKHRAKKFKEILDAYGWQAWQQGMKETNEALKTTENS